jgi:hypothetical protein
MQVDGIFVLYDHNGQPKRSTGTNGKGNKSSIFQVADEGNIFIFSGGKVPRRPKSVCTVRACLVLWGPKRLRIGVVRG